MAENAAKIKLKSFVDLKNAENFVNSFSEKNNVLRKHVIPIVKKQKIFYFVCLEYTH